MVCVCVEIGPELDQEESVLRSPVVQILQTFTLLRELVLDLPHVHRLNRRQLKAGPCCQSAVSLPLARSLCSQCDLRYEQIDVCGSRPALAAPPRRPSAPAASACWLQCSGPAREPRPGVRWSWWWSWWGRPAGSPSCHHGC